MLHIQREGNHNPSLIEDASKYLWTCFKTTAAKEINLDAFGILMTFIPIKRMELLRERIKLDEKENLIVRPKDTNV